MTRFARRTDKSRELTDLHRNVVELRERLAEEQQATAALHYRLHDLERRNLEIANELHAERTEPERRLTDRRQPAPRRTEPLPPPPMSAPSVEALATKAAEAGDEVARNSWLVEEVQQAVHHLTRRLDELSAHFERRLGELGYEIERAAASSRATAAVGDLSLVRQLDSVREMQLRLANEQARFEIALRNELADVADQLARP